LEHRGLGWIKSEVNKDIAAGLRHLLFLNQRPTARKVLNQPLSHNFWRKMMHCSPR
jgi:hypothetical protein